MSIPSRLSLWDSKSEREGVGVGREKVWVKKRGKKTLINIKGSDCSAKQWGLHSVPRRCHFKQEDEDKNWQGLAKIDLKSLQSYLSPGLTWLTQRLMSEASQPLLSVTTLWFVLEANVVSIAITLRAKGLCSWSDRTLLSSDLARLKKKMGDHSCYYGFFFFSILKGSFRSHFPQ